MSDKKLPQGWVKVQLNDLVKNPKSDLVDGPFGSNLKSSEYVESGIPVLKIQNIKANRFVEKRLSYVTSEKAAELSRHSFMAGDLMITKLGEPLGLCCEVPFHLKHGIFVADLMRLRPAPEIISSKFLLHAINSVIVQNQFKEITKGTTRQRVNLSVVREINIELPPLNEQHRIVAKIEELFSELDKGIENLKTARAQLKVYRQALLKNAFEGKLTAQWRAENQDKLETAADLLTRIQTEREQRYRQQLQQWEATGKHGSKPKAPKPLPPLTAQELAQLPKLPAGWGWARFGSLDIDIKRGPFGSSITKSMFVPSGFKVYEQGNAIYRDAARGSYFINAEKYEELSGFAVLPGDFIVSCAGTVGRIYELPENATAGVINQALMRVRINDAILSRYFFATLFESAFFQRKVLSDAKGTAMVNLAGVKELNLVPVAICGVEEQKLIVELLDARLSEVDQLDQTITISLQQAEALRQSILKKAFSGQLVPQDPHDEPASALLARIKAKKCSSGR